MKKPVSPIYQYGRFGLVGILLTMICSAALIATGYWMGQQSHRELAGVVSAPQQTANRDSGNLDALIQPRSTESLTGRWRVTEATRDTPLRDVEFYSDGRVQLRDGEGSGFLGTYTAKNGRLQILAAEDQGSKELFSGSYSMGNNRLTITHNDVVVVLASGPEAEQQVADFLIDHRSWRIGDVEKVAIRTDERFGCHSELAEALRDEDLEVVGESLADAFVVVRIERQPISSAELPLANISGWRYFYSAALLGKEDTTLFEYEGEAEEETELEACEELAEVVAEEIVDAID